MSKISFSGATPPYSKKHRFNLYTINAGFKASSNYICSEIEKSDKIQEFIKNGKVRLKVGDVARINNKWGTIEAMSLKARHLAIKLNIKLSSQRVYDRRGELLEIRDVFIPKGLLIPL